MNYNKFFEDWDGEIVLGAVSDFDDAEDFIEQAQKYFNGIRGFVVPINKESLEIIDIVFDDTNEAWWRKAVANEQGLEEELITVYKVNLDWENAES